MKANTDNVDDEDIEALQVSYVLWALGWANYVNHKLHSITLYVGGPAFWSAENLRCLWDGNGHSKRRDDQLLYHEAVESESLAYYDNDRDIRLQREQCSRQLAIMEHALLSLMK